MKKKVLSLILLIAVLCTVVSCGKKKVAEETKPVATTPAPIEVVNTAPAKEPEPVKPAEEKPTLTPVVEIIPTEETVVIKETDSEKIAFVPVKYLFSYGDIKADAVFDKGNGTITFNGGVTKDQITFIIGEIVKAHPELASVLKFSISENPVTVKLYYDEDYTADDLKYVVNIFTSEFDKAIAAYVASITPVEEPVAVVEPAPVFEPVVYDFSYGDIRALAVFNKGEGSIVFNNYVTKDQIMFIIGEVVKAHPELAKALTFSMTDAPVIVTLNYDEGYTVDDLKYIIGVFTSEFDKAIAAYVASITPVEEPVAVVEPAPAVEPVVEPVAEVVVPAVEPTVEPEVKKFDAKNNIRIAVTPVNFMPKEKKVTYSLGAEFEYEMRLEERIAFAAAVDYRMYLNREKAYIADHAATLNLINYTHISENCAFFAGFGVGANLFVAEKTLKVNPMVKGFGGIEVRLNDLVSIRCSSSVEASFTKDGCRVSLQPANIGIQFTL